MSALALACTGAVAATSAPVAPAVAPAAGPLEVFGHSYAAGAGASTPSAAWAPKLGALLGSAPVVNHGVPGAVVSTQFFKPPGAERGAQSWWWAYRNVLPSSNPAAGPRPGQPAVFTGLDDVPFPDMGVTLEAIRAFVARVGENAVVEDTSPSIAYGPPWATVNQTNRNSGTTAHGTISPTPGAIRIVTPRSFPGGTVVLHGAVYSGRWRGTIRVEGLEVGEFDAATDSSGRGRLVVIPIRRLPPGRTRIELRTTNISGAGVQFDFWGSITAASPYVLLFKQPLLPPALDAVHPSTSAGIAALNSGIDRIARDFGGVLAVDLPAMNGNPAFFKADEANPNDLGHSYIAAQAAARLRAAPARAAPPARKLTRLRFSRSTFAAAGRGATLSAARRVGTTVRFRLSAISSVRFTVQRLKGRRFVRTRGSFTYAATAGRQRLTFTGRMANRKLKPGRYRLVAGVRGAKGKPVRKAFRIVR
jgi:hypothetical protein